MGDITLCTVCEINEDDCSCGGSAVNALAQRRIRDRLGTDPFARIQAVAGHHARVGSMVADLQAIAGVMSDGLAPDQLAAVDYLMGRIDADYIESFGRSMFAGLPDPQWPGLGPDDPIPPTTWHNSVYKKKGIKDD